MKNLIIIMVLFVTVSSCKQKSETKPPGKKQVASPLKHYFEFNEVAHYKIDIDSRKAGELINKRNKTRQDTLLLIATSSVSLPQTLADTNFVSSLETLPFKKRIVPNAALSSINDIFKEKVPTEKIDETSCLPVFRDILIFRKSNSVVGLAKICFECQKHHIVGTSANTFMFGQQGDYKKLEAILIN